MRVKKREKTKQNRIQAYLQAMMYSWQWQVSDAFWLFS